MAGIKISQLPLTLAAELTDVLPVVQSGVTSGETLNEVLNLFEAQLGFTGTVLQPANGGTGVASPTAHTIPIGEGTAPYNFIGPLTDGEVLIGSTGIDPVAATLVAGTGITISNGAGSITISSSDSPVITYTTVTAGTQTMSTDNGYVANNNSTRIVFTVPDTFSVGDELEVMGLGSAGWQLAQPAGINIVYGNKATTVGVGGSLSSTGAQDTCFMKGLVANTMWKVYASVSTGLTVV